MATRRAASSTLSSAKELQDSTDASVPNAAELVAAADEAPAKKTANGFGGVPSMVPALVALSAVMWYLTVVLGTMSGPIIGGIKLVYAGAIAGIISRSCCAPLEMVSTVMMCRGNECLSLIHI